MRKLTPAEIEEIDDNGESDEGMVAIETTIAELASLEAGTMCGLVGNHCFVNIAKALEHPENHRVIGWFEKANPNMPDHDTNAMCGMVQIECTEEQGTIISQAASDGDGSLRFEDGDTDLTFKFRYFEIE